MMLVVTSQTAAGSELFQGDPQVARQGSIKASPRKIRQNAVHGGKYKLCCVKELPAKAEALAELLVPISETIFYITNDRMSNKSKVAADLMCFSGDQINL